MSNEYKPDSESIAAAEQEKNEQAQRYRDIVAKAYAHVQRGDLLGPPDDRPANDLDAVVEGVVGALRAEVRLYPELWAWIVSDQVRLALRPDLDAVRAKAQVEALRMAADDITLSFSRGMVLATATECHKKQCRCGNPAPEELARQIALAYRDQIRDESDRIAREAGIETKEASDD